MSQAGGSKFLLRQKLPFESPIYGDVNDPFSCGTTSSQIDGKLQVSWARCKWSNLPVLFSLTNEVISLEIILFIFIVMKKSPNFIVNMLLLFYLFLYVL